MYRSITSAIFFLLLFESLVVCAQEKEDPFRYEKNNFKLRIIAQNPEQMAGFYEGRGFSKPALEEIKKACFITVLMTNNSNTMIWLDINRWRLYANDKPIERYKRTYWKTKFNERNIPLAHQATFGWTLLPETRDLYPNEPVGGNVTMVKTQASFTMEMRFQTGANKDGKEIVVKFDEVQCKQ
jgi:hypothetical protein